MKLKTNFWEEKDHKIWKEKFVRMIYITAIFIMGNLAYFAIAEANTIIQIANLILFIYFIIVIISYNKYKRGQNGRENNTTTKKSKSEVPKTPTQEIQRKHKKLL